MSKTTNKFAPEVGARTVRIVLDENPGQGHAIDPAVTPLQVSVRLGSVKSVSKKRNFVANGLVMGACSTVDERDGE